MWLFVDKVAVLPRRMGALRAGFVADLLLQNNFGQQRLAAGYRRMSLLTMHPIPNHSDESPNPDVFNAVR
ncbi:hypothetical protein [Desulfonatronum thiosulfatophilum]|uniref:hypothetical protein n=1 Tax=Desulfonatronum thiosulfatophilum TaxID=617002 RepID=UPI0011133987|nr:hypothetical protein [Desulfonatronum thiosulfatophilum]